MTKETRIALMAGFYIAVGFILLFNYADFKF